ncbi:MAG: hypothetical protein WC216_03430 [Gallionella sp.]|jgi:hypothetical protein
MNRHLITLATLLTALAFYGLGMTGLGIAAFAAGGIFELWFWIRLLVRHKPKYPRSAP